MELWIEYLIRKKLFHLIPPEYREEKKPLIIIVKPCYQTEFLMWTYFLTLYRPFIQMFSAEVCENCDKWLKDRNPYRPPLDIQRQIIFKVAPHLKSVWQKDFEANVDRW